MYMYTCTSTTTRASDMDGYGTTSTSSTPLESTQSQRPPHLLINIMSGAESDDQIPAGAMGLFTADADCNYHHYHNHNHNHNEWMSHSSSPSSSSTYGSPMSAGFQRSLSSHSLHHIINNITTHDHDHHSNNSNAVLHYHRHLMSHSSPTPKEYLDMDPSSVRRVLSTGDLHRMKKGWCGGGTGRSSLSSESNAIIQGMNRASPYSPEEKKERIERYRSKRNHRNFTKKIKYACRKTLADSRPRIRGRFARNDEIENQVQWNHLDLDEDEEEEDDDNWINYLDSFSPNLFT